MRCKIFLGFEELGKRKMKGNVEVVKEGGIFGYSAITMLLYSLANVVNFN